MYLELVSIPLTYHEVYKFSLGQASLIYSTQIIGSFAGFAIEGYCGRLYQKHVAKLGSEARLYTACKHDCRSRLGTRMADSDCLSLGSFRRSFLSCRMLDLWNDFSTRDSFHRPRHWTHFPLYEIILAFRAIPSDSYVFMLADTGLYLVFVATYGYLSDAYALCTSSS